jgi:hypothetical protein
VSDGRTAVAALVGFWMSLESSCGRGRNSHNASAWNRKPVVLSVAYYIADQPFSDAGI